MKRSRATQRSIVAVLVAVTLLPLAACSDDGPSPGESVPGLVTIELDNRPFRLYVPGSYDPATPAPLVIGLHGYTSRSAELESYFMLTAQADQRAFLYAMPDGTPDSGRDRFWNATDACCDLDGSGVDDSTYLSRLIDTVKDSYSVDGERVFIVGHSNGGYMAHRMACDHADQVTAIASLAGVVWADTSRCAPSRPVSVLQIHGTADPTVRYGGGTFPGGRVYPGAEQTVATWRQLNGCTEVADTSTPPRDLDQAVDGPETTVSVFADGCRDGTRVELWRMDGSRHVPSLTDAFTPAVLDFFYSAVRSEAASR
jgi:polyhydroxybutyrate depolymerase